MSAPIIAAALNNATIADPFGMRAWPLYRNNAAGERSTIINSYFADTAEVENDAVSAYAAKLGETVAKMCVATEVIKAAPVKHYAIVPPEQAMHEGMKKLETVEKKLLHRVVSGLVDNERLSRFIELEHRAADHFPNKERYGLFTKGIAKQGPLNLLADDYGVPRTKNIDGLSWVIEHDPRERQLAEFFTGQGNKIEIAAVNELLTPIMSFEIAQENQLAVRALEIAASLRAAAD